MVLMVAMQYRCGRGDCPRHPAKYSLLHGCMQLLHSRRVLRTHASRKVQIKTSTYFYFCVSITPDTFGVVIYVTM
jgi:hypothetical protein